MHGPSEVKQHAWLANINWQSLIEKKQPAPFKPEPRPPLTNTNMDKEPQGAEMLEESMMLLRRNSIQKLFNGYDYDIE